MHIHCSLCTHAIESIPTIHTHIYTRYRVYTHAYTIQKNERKTKEAKIYNRHTEKKSRERRETAFVACLKNLQAKNFFQRCLLVSLRTFSAALLCETVLTLQSWSHAPQQHACDIMRVCYARVARVCAYLLTENDY